MPESANSLVLRLVAERLNDTSFTAAFFTMLKGHAGAGEMPSSAMTAKSFETACSFSTACSFDTALSGAGSRTVDSLEGCLAGALSLDSETALKSHCCPLFSDETMSDARSELFNITMSSTRLSTARSGTADDLLEWMRNWDLFHLSSQELQLGTESTSQLSTVPKPMSPLTPIMQWKRANVGLCDTVISNSTSLTQLVRGFATIERFLIENVSLPPDAINDDFARELAQRGCAYAMLRPFNGLRLAKGTRFVEMTDDGILALCFDCRDAIPFRRIYVDRPSISKDLVRNLVERSASSPMTNQVVLTVTNVRLDELNISEYSANRSDFKLFEGDYTNLDFEHANGIRLQLCFDHQLYGESRAPWVTVRRGPRDSPGIFRDIANGIMTPWE